LYLYTKQGAMVDAVNLIRDGDELVLKLSAVDCYREWVSLNVGGHVLQTSVSTLTKEKESMLAKMFDPDNQWDNKRDDSGAYLIDRSPAYFIPLLDYLRNGEVIIDDNVNPKGVLLEAKFFGLVKAIEQIEVYIKRKEVKGLEPLVRDDVVKTIMSTPSNYILRCKGLDFSNADLSKLDLKHINFAGAKLCGVNFEGADLYGAVLDKADMTNVILDGAYVAGVSMEGAILDGASIKNCSFEDPKLRPSSLLGAHMRGVNLENSLLCGANLRVANLRGSNLKNTSLRGACLAGADLEDCNLTGCDLENTNLRGANLRGTKFEEMPSALHMAQIQGTGNR